MSDQRVLRLGGFYVPVQTLDDPAWFVNKNTLICGIAGSGKSVVLRNILHTLRHTPEIACFAEHPSEHDGVVPPHALHASPTALSLKKLWSRRGSQNCVVVMDSVTCALNQLSRGDDKRVVADFYHRGRHHGYSMVTAAQGLASTPRVIRQNAHVTLFTCHTCLEEHLKEHRNTTRDMSVGEALARDINTFAEHRCVAFNNFSDDAPFSVIETDFIPRGSFRVGSDEFWAAAPEAGVHM